MKLKLVDEARNAWKWASVQLAVVAGAVAAWAATDTNGFVATVNLLPDWLRPLLGLLVTVTAIGSRVVKAQRDG